MKRIFALLLMVAFIGTFSYAQQTNTNAQVAPLEEAPADGPVMTFESTTVDYGVIEQNADPFRTFTFTNTGNKPLQITHAKGSCGCTTPEWPKEPIMPGEEGKIKVRYATNRLGKFVKTVTLTTNETVGKQKLTIKGEVLKKKEEAEGVPSAPNSFGGK